MAIIEKNLLEYLRTVQPEFSGLLGDLQRHALAEGFPIIPPETARLLSVLVSVKQPMNVLEIGCAVGFSASLIATHMPDGGAVTTIDRYPFMIERAKVNFQKMGMTDKITLLEGDAKDILPALQSGYDFIFLDAGKGQYLNFLPHCLRLLEKGGMLVADNVLQNGTVVMDPAALPRRQRSLHKRMNEFLWIISNTEGLETSIIPIGDGLSVTVKATD